MTVTQIDHDATTILRILAEPATRDTYTTGHKLATQSDLTPDRINDAVALLVDAGHVKLATQSDLTPDRINDAVALLVDAGHVAWTQTLGTAPYDFGDVEITPRGRYESQRLAQSRQHAIFLPNQALEPATVTSSDITILPPVPVGSPYGFTDEDWETVAEHKGRQDCIYSVLGHQFDSEHFDAEILRINVESMMRDAVDRYNSRSSRDRLSLKHDNLSAGYGEHLFNEIARDIIGADLAVFEVSDLNPNVMLEMGVALTWGVRVLPIKATGRPKPPSDVSGQTWADYTENGSAFADPEHDRKLVQMVERAIRKKGNRAG